jgi:cyclic pyranopterin phosphate synthase
MADGCYVPKQTAPALVDGFGRAITYLRVSVTDRCDFRCVYCMSEDARFLPKAEVLSLEELARLCGAFIDQGVRKLRITGGEPLVRRGVLTLFEALGRHRLAGRLDELTLTTNGSQLARHAGALAGYGVRRVNVSLDTLDAAQFRAITRRGELAPVLAGIEAARRAGLTVKLNCVALKGGNEDQFDRLISWAGARGLDLTLIEVMPLGDLDGQSRQSQFLPLSKVRERLERRWTLEPSDHRTGGPSRYVRVRETGCRLGFITPLTGNFCEGCNRVRLTATGQLYLCLGREQAVDLRSVVRAHPAGDDAPLAAAIRTAIAHKPEGHAFAIGRCSGSSPLERAMHVTGG